MNVQIYRTNASSYQNPSFFVQEKNILEKIEGVKYIKSLNEINNEDPFILITNTHTKSNQIPKVLLDKTILVIHPNSGHDNFPLDFIQDSSFPIVLGNPIRSHAVAEYMIGCMFNHFTKIENHLHWSNDRTWERKLLRDQKVLILGNGHIGKVVKSSLTSLCREVKVYDPFVENQFNHSDLQTSYDKEMFKGVQVLLLAQSLNTNSSKMINNDIFKLLDPECLIVNAARGGLIEEEHLIHFLQKNPRAFAYLDVFENEPFTPGHLHDIKNVNKTSHIAGVYKKLNQDIISYEYHIIKEFLGYVRKSKEDEFFADYKECLLTSRIQNEMLV
jgi:D-3-phosphoglycerate dehydrogenase